MTDDWKDLPKPYKGLAGPNSKGEGAAKPEKPVIPHYSRTRRALWAVVKDYDIAADSDQGQERWHNEQAQTYRESATRKRELSKALKAAAEALGGMDKASIVVAPDPDAPGGSWK